MIRIVVREDEAPAVIFKKLADAEAEIRCQVFFNPADPENPKEEERLHFETTPPLPKFQKPKAVEDSPGWINFLMMLKKGMLELRP